MDPLDHLVEEVLKAVSERQAAVEGLDGLEGMEILVSLVLLDPKEQLGSLA